MCGEVDPSYIRQLYRNRRQKIFAGLKRYSEYDKNDWARLSDELRFEDYTKFLELSILLEQALCAMDCRA